MKNWAVQNNSGIDFSELIDLIDDFVPYAGKQIGFKNPPPMFLESDPINARNILGKTAHYEPVSSQITIFIDGRHPKDILRSIAHELVHHFQNERGDLEGEYSTEPGYAQTDDHMRELEREAYESGSLCFRDWEDKRKKMLNESIYYNQEKKTMSSLNEWKNKTVNNLLMKKFGLLKEEFDDGQNYKVAGNTTSSDDGDETGAGSLAEDGLTEEPMSPGSRQAALESKDAEEKEVNENTSLRESVFAEVKRILDIKRNG